MGYLDMSSAFVYQKSLFQSKLDQLAENDNVLNSRSIPDGTKPIFFQASVPVGYTQDVSNNGKLLTIVSGAGGGTAGSFDISGTILKNHTAHSVPSSAHSHEGSSHEHATDFALATDFVDGTNDYLDPTGPITDRQDASGGTQNVLREGLQAVSTGVFSSTSQDHGGATTGAALGDISFRFLNVIVGSKDVNSFVFTNLFAEFDHNDKINFDPFALLNGNDKYLEEALLRPGTVCLFPQEATPTSWTHTTTASSQGAGMRVVSGAGGGKGGTNDMSLTFVIGHTHTLTSDAAHSHTINAHSHTMKEVSVNDAGGSGGDFFVPDGGNFLERFPSGATPRNASHNTTQTDGGGGSLATQGAHTHTVDSFGTNFTNQIVKTELATKDSGGSPQAFLDQSAVLIFKKLASLQKLNQLGKNDEYINFHQIEETTIMIFFQASAPIGWTQITTLDDYAPTYTGSAGGASQGTKAIKDTISLAHTHVIQTGGSHTHVTIDHTHTLAFSSENTGTTTGEFATIPTPTTDPLRSKLATGSTGRNKAKNIFISVGGTATNDISHNHSGSTGSLLSDVTLATMDAIMCSKD